MSFTPANVLDGRDDTAWRCPGDASGHHISVDFARPVELRAIGAVPGYAKVDDLTGADRFAENRRMRSAEWQCVGATGQILASARQEFADESRLQQIGVQGFSGCTTVRMVVIATSPPGLRDFTAVSEITLRTGGTPEPVDQAPPVPHPRRVVPVLGPVEYADEHHDYPATDIFSSTAQPCGATVVAAADGTVLEVRLEDRYDVVTDNPALRGGRSVSVLGDDGVRYYYAHLASVERVVVPGRTVQAGDRLGTVGDTGRTSACHLHFALSPPCPGPEWAVRRGVVSPFRYLQDWAEGGTLSPAPEVERWRAAHPSACAEAMAEPSAADA